jgi:hypothetical protein
MEISSGLLTISDSDVLGSPNDTMTRKNTHPLGEAKEPWTDKICLYFGKRGLEGRHGFRRRDCSQRSRSSHAAHGWLRKDPVTWTWWLTRLFLGNRQSHGQLGYEASTLLY